MKKGVLQFICNTFLFLKQMVKLQTSTMKFLFVGGVLAFLKTVTFVPTVSLLVAMAFVIGLDFLTGCYKAKMQGKARTSEGFRKTISKFVQYGCAVASSCVLAFVSQHKGGEAVKLLTGLLNDGLVIFIIYIEVTSIFENLYAVEPESPMAKYFYAPALKILTFQIKNNPIMKQAEALKKEEEANKQS